MSGAARARGPEPTPARVAAAFAWAVAAAALAIAASWAVGQAVLDRWPWSQWLFWIPAWSVAVAAGLGIAALARWARGGRGRDAALALLAAAAAWSAVRSLWTDVGWSIGGAAPPGTVSVTHWNPQWPGAGALAAGRALAGELGDIAVITSPGSMLRSAVRDEWLPEGVEAQDLGAVGIVVRGRILHSRMLASRTLGTGRFMWAAWFDVEVPSGRVRVLALDLPSDPMLPRSAVAAELADLFAGVPVPGAPDVVVGDCNATPGSVVFGAIPFEGLRRAPPWRSAGWLGTYPRAFPFLRIDAMLAAPGCEWVGYRTLDMGTGRHRAQRGVLRVPPG